MRPFILLTISALAAAVHRTYATPAGPDAYLFLFSLPVLALLYTPRLRAQNYWLSLTGLIEAWFIFDYALYGTAISALGRTKIPLSEPIDLAYNHAYLIGALAFAAFALGAFLAFALPAESGETNPNSTSAFYLLFTLAGLASIAILLLDPESRRQLFFEHIGLNPREGMGRYTALLFMLPTTAIALWFTLIKHPRSRLLSIAVLTLIAALHLGYGRRLMWASAMLMVFHLLKVRGLFTLRPIHLAAALPLILLVSLWMEATKNIGWSTAAERLRLSDFASAGAVLAMVDNSVGRFDATAALIANRQDHPYDHGRTFLLAPLQVLPVAAGLPRTRGVREELGELIYGNFHRDLVSQEPSLVGELYANFGSTGVIAGFLLIGFLAAFIDAHCHHNPAPLVAIGYGLCLFRVVHQLGTASTSWVPLTLMAFTPWGCTATWVHFTRRSK